MKYWMVLWLLIATAATAAPRSQGQSGEFDFYVLSLSWSPTFCLTHPGNEQCSGKGYGFVLHGLWPQYARGGWPASCAPQMRERGRNGQGRGAVSHPCTAQA